MTERVDTMAMRERWPIDRYGELGDDIETLCSEIDHLRILLDNAQNGPDT